MRGKLLICDGCKAECRELNDGMMGTRPTYEWLTLTRGASSSDNAVMAGEYNFCSEKCLVEWITKATHNDKLSHGHQTTKKETI